MTAKPAPAPTRTARLYAEDVELVRHVSLLPPSAPFPVVLREVLLTMSAPDERGERARRAVAERCRRAAP